MAGKIKAKRILQLSAGGLPRRSIAKMKGFSEHGVMDTLNAAAEMGISYEGVADMDDEEVYALLFPERNNHEPAYEEPDWEYVHKELARTGVTLRLLHSIAGSRYLRYRKLGYTHKSRTISACLEYSAVVAESTEGFRESRLLWPSAR